MFGTDLEKFIDSTGLEYSDAPKVREDLSDKTIVGWLVEYPDYEGYASLVCKDEMNNWYFWEGSHCSCYGFEDQWELQKSNPKMLLEKKFYFYAYGDEEINLLKEQINKYM